jgi:two-component system, NarL family, sensor kinase
MRIPARAHRTFGGRRTEGRTSVASALTAFTIAGLVATIVLGVAGVYLLQRAGREDATKDAKRVTAIVGDGIIQPLLTPELMRGDPKAIAALDRAVHRNVLRDPVVRVKVWTPDGRIIYSDEHRLIGQRYPVSEEDKAILKEGGVEAELSDLSGPENRYEPRGERLLEVYLPLRTPNGQLVRFESYQRFNSVLANGRDTWKTFLPALVGGLVILWLVQLPLAARLARRIERGRREREALLRRAVDASDAERRRIAADLHDGVVQSLAGVSYSLAAAADRVGSANGNGNGNGHSGHDTGEEALRRGATATRDSIAELRTLLVDIYPPNLQSAGLRSALEDLVAPLARGECEATVDVTDQPLPPGVDALFFRVAQEALRNVSKHAEAQRVSITVDRTGDTATLLIEDDGKGFDPEAARAVQREGHVGVRVLADLVHDAGGELTIDSQPGQGTRVRAEVVLA